MRQTIDRHRVGTTTYRVYAYWQIPLADPEALGNGGLEGFDEDSEADMVDTLERAEKWLRQTVNAHPARIWTNARIDTIEWVADEYVWDEFGKGPAETILDAMEQHTHSRYYYVAHEVVDGRDVLKVEFENEYDERGW